MSIDVLRHSGGWGRRIKRPEAWAKRIGRVVLKSIVIPAKAGIQPIVKLDPRLHGDDNILELSIVLSDDARIRDLNHTYRGRNKPTNVLSFPANPSPRRGEVGRGAGLHNAGVSNVRPHPNPPPMGEGIANLPPAGEGVYLGDVVLAYETIAREATAQGKTFRDHATHLLIHGILHLMGYDHAKKRDAQTMERTEIQILKKLGLANPY